MKKAEEKKITKKEIGTAMVMSAIIIAIILTYIIGASNTRQETLQEIGNAYCQDMYNTTYKGIWTNCTDCNTYEIICKNGEKRKIR